MVLQKGSAKIKIKIFDKIKILKKDGNGPIDAIFSALKNVIPNKINLLVYQVNAITKGTDAIAEVSVRIEEESITVLGQGSDLDTLVASAKAYINAINKLIVKRDKLKDAKNKIFESNEKIDKHVI